MNNEQVACHYFFVNKKEVVFTFIEHKEIFLRKFRVATDY